MTIWYRTGTVNLTNDSAVVIGTGTQFVEFSRPGDALLLPGGLFEIASRQSATALTLAAPYTGPTAAGVGFAVVPVPGYSKELADKVAHLLDTYGDGMNDLVLEMLNSRLDDILAAGIDELLVDHLNAAVAEAQAAASTATDAQADVSAAHADVMPAAAAVAIQHADVQAWQQQVADDSAAAIAASNSAVPAAAIAAQAAADAETAAQQAQDSAAAALEHGNGWSPIYAVIADGQRNVLQVFDWLGGTGPKPATGGYLTLDGGLTTVLADAANIRGAQGPKGDTGTGITVLGSLASSGDLPASGNTLGDAYMIDGNLWVWEGAAWIDAGNIQGPAGPQGQSAYEVAVAAGFTGTVGEWLASLQAPDVLADWTAAPGSPGAIQNQPAVIAAGANEAAARLAIKAARQLEVVRITANTAAEAGRYYEIAAVGVTLTMPAAPADGDQIGFCNTSDDDVQINWSSKTVKRKTPDAPMTLPANGAALVRWIETNGGTWA